MNAIPENTGNSPPALTLDQAMKNIEGMPEYKVISAELETIRRNNIIALGEDEAFAMRDKEGEIRAYKQRVRLSLKDKTLVQIPGADVVVSAQGYEVWAEAAGAAVIFPKEVLVGNQWQLNPHAERDPHDRRILAVHARAVAFRFSSKGIPQVSDWTTIFDTPTYRLIDLLAKAKKCPQAFKLLPADMQPEDQGTWASYPFDESTNLWVETSHAEALTWYSQILNREKKAMDFAQTFAKRNALKHLSGLQKAPGAAWDLAVLCWRPTSGNIIKWDATQYVQLQDKVGGLIQGNGEEFQANQIEMDAGVERTSEDEEAAGLEGQIDPEDQPIEVPHTVEAETVEPAQGELTAEAQRIMKNLKAATADFPDEVKEAMDRLGLDPEKPMTALCAESVLKELGQILDQANE